jgi:hypothetical protein
MDTSISTPSQLLILVVEFVRQASALGLIFLNVVPRIFPSLSKEVVK